MLKEKRGKGGFQGIAGDLKVALRLERDLDNDTHTGMGNKKIGRRDSNRSSSIDDTTRETGTWKNTITNISQVNVPKTRYVTSDTPHPHAYTHSSHSPTDLEISNEYHLR